MDQLLSKQKVERAIDSGRSEFTALLLEPREQCVGSHRLIGRQDQLEDASPDQRHSRTTELADLLRPRQCELDLAGRHTGPPAGQGCGCYSVTERLSPR